VAIVFTLDYTTPHRMGKRRVQSGTLAFDNSYTTAGEAITAAQLGFITVIDQLVVTGGAKGHKIEFDQAGLLLKVTAPAYSRHLVNPAQAPVTLTDAAADITTFQFGRDLYVVGFSSVVTTVLACETVQPAVLVAKRDADGVSNSVTMATITYAATDAVGVVDSIFAGGGAVGDGVATSTLPYRVPAGYTIVLRHSVQGTGVAATGAAKCHIFVADIDEGEDLWSTADLSGLTAVEFIALGY